MNMSARLRGMLQKINDDVSRDLLTSTNTKHGDYLGIRSGNLTYLPTAKLDTEKPYASRSRVRGKPAKVARKFTMNEHSDAAYEQFYHRLNALAFSVKNLALLKGDAIMDAYNDQYDPRKQSSMMRSCMVGAGSHRFRLYTENPDAVRLLVLKDRFKGRDVIVARALVWKTDQGIYVDRIYGSETAIRFVERYVDTKGWMRYNRSRWGMSGKPTKTIRVNIKGLDTFKGSYPYLDTFLSRRDGNDVYLEGAVAV